jgi:hypothetical protein
MGLPYLIQLFSCGFIYFYYGYRLNAVLAAIYVTFRFINGFWFVILAIVFVAISLFRKAKGEPKPMGQLKLNPLEIAPDSGMT